jgi:threonine/homoserine/homoserine lactone efflux protein
MLTALLTFLGATILVSLAPGPSTAIILRQSIRSGRRAGVAAMLGNETGVLAWGMAAAFGLSALLLASRLAYDTMRVAGAAVLVTVGLRMLWRTIVSNGRAGGAQNKHGERSKEEEVTVPGDTSGRAFRLGLLTNLANPKAGVFAVSFLPQFVPHGAPVFPMLILFSVLWVMIDAVWYLTLIWLAGRAHRVLRRPVVQRRMEQASGLVLVGVGVTLAVEST